MSLCEALLHNTRLVSTVQIQQAELQTVVALLKVRAAPSGRASGCCKQAKPEQLRSLEYKSSNHEQCWPLDGLLGSGAAGSDSYCSEGRAPERREELKCVVSVVMKALDAIKALCEISWRL
jgi:hypothetical protein